MLLCIHITWSFNIFLENGGKTQSYVKMENNSRWRTLISKLNHNHVFFFSSRVSNRGTSLMCSRLQFSEESVSSVEPSLSTSILLLWWMFFLGEAFLCTSLRAPTALPLLLLPGLTEIWAILDSVKEGKKCREEVNRAKCSEAKQHILCTDADVHFYVYALTICPVLGPFLGQWAALPY